MSAVLTYIIHRRNPWLGITTPPFAPRSASSGCGSMLTARSGRARRTIWCIDAVIPGRREAASPESIRRDGRRLEDWWTASLKRRWPVVMDSGRAPAARPGMTTPHKLPRNCQITSSTTITSSAITSVLRIAQPRFRMTDTKNPSVPVRRGVISQPSSERNAAATNSSALSQSTLAVSSGGTTENSGCRAM